MTFDADDVDDVKFDEDITFIRTIAACAGQSSNCEFSASHGAWHMQSVNDYVAIPIEGIHHCKLHTVKFFFMNEAGNPNPTDMSLTVYKKAGLTIDAGATVIVQETAHLDADSSLNMPAGIELDCADENMVGELAPQMYYGMVKLTETDILVNPMHFIGVRIEYKRSRVVV